MPDVDLSFLPESLAARGELSGLLSELVNAAGDNLESLILFGSAAAGSYDPRTSDINLAVVLRRDDRDVLEAIKGPLSKLIRQFKVSPMVTTGEELRTSADVFPVKFLGIKEQHRVLAGGDPFAAMSIKRVHLRLRCEQELKNMALKLRRSIVSRAATPQARQELIRSFLPPFATVLRTLLQLAGQTAPQGREEVLRQAARAFDLPAEQVEHLVLVSWSEEGGDLGADELEDLSHAFLRVVSRAAAVADKMAEAIDAEAS